MNNINQSRMQQRNLLFKILFILFLIILLMIPNTMIKHLTMERENLQDKVRSEIASSWGPDQLIAGPMLTIPFKNKYVSKDINQYHKLRVLPEAVDMKVNMDTEERKKSIYSTILYNANHQLEIIFRLPDIGSFGSEVEEIMWDDAVIDIGFSSASSLDEIVYMEWEGVRKKMNSGTSDNHIFSSGIHAHVDVAPQKDKYQMKVAFGINGSKAINYLPCANNTTISMASNWASPGFSGLPLPQSHDINADGFHANWKTTEYNRSFKSNWIDNEIRLQRNHGYFGVSLVEMVGHYQKNMRSSKYALLIISLSFMVFFFFEILKGSKIHPVQYGMVGISLSIFYLLLLSLTEHIGFDFSYLVASGSVVILIAWYSRYLFHSNSRALILGMILTGLYGYVFVLLQMEEFALVTGSIGLFTILVIVMYLSRHFNWYEFKIDQSTR